jgi:hypothetical protein
MKRILALGLLVLASETWLPAKDKLAIRVSPSVAFAPANLVIRTTIDADNRNRTINVSAESDTFYRSSELQLDGERAPHTAVFEFRSVPMGQYRVRVELMGDAGDQLAYAQSSVNVVASGGTY